jgi:hypothetical protein
MMDQLASIDVEFDDDSFNYTVARTQACYDSTPPKAFIPKAFAKEPIYTANNPRRPWALGAICRDTNLLWRLTGSHVRRPGMQRQAATGCSKGARPPFLKDTSERIHSSVRVRMLCEGLDLNDEGLWTCRALRGYWQLKKRRLTFDSLEGPTEAIEGGGERYVYVYVGPLDESAERTLAEEPMGPFERRLLEMTAGEPNVWQYASV